MDQDARHDLKLKKCRWCGQEFLTPIPNKLYCCDLHRERANRYNKKMWARNYRKQNGLPDNHNETSRKAMQRYREHWLFSNKNEQLGSGKLSKKRNKDFNSERKIIKWEKRRLKIE